MELDKIITLINTVSNSALTGLVLDEGNLHLELQKVSVSGGQAVSGTGAIRLQGKAAESQSSTLVSQGAAEAGVNFAQREFAEANSRLVQPGTAGVGSNFASQESVETGFISQESVGTGSHLTQLGTVGVGVVPSEAGKTVQAEALGTPVCSPLVGTFYCSPSEGEPPFVKVGDRVTKGQVLGIIEAMKLMNEIEAEQDGVITAVLVENEQMVEYGQKLFLIQ